MNCSNSEPSLLFLQQIQYPHRFEEQKRLQQLQLQQLQYLQQLLQRQQQEDMLCSLQAQLHEQQRLSQALCSLLLARPPL